MKLSHTVLSTQTCIICNKPLKQNLINKQPNADICYKHHRISTGKPPYHTPRLKRLNAGLPVHRAK